MGSIEYDRINNTLGKMRHYLGNHDCISVSVSGGSDSDVIVHMIATYFRDFLPKIHFVFSNTGIEYAATLRHIEYLKDRYHIDIEEVWGMTRTGCVGCPFNSKVGEDLKKIKQYEPLLYRACMNVFGESYRLMDKFDVHRHKILEDDNHE